jgi:hypothetical protein
MKERIRNILKEESLKKTLIDMVQEGGVYSAEGLVGGVENLLEILNIETPMEYLYLFNDLEMVKDPEWPNLILFKNKSKHNIMLYILKQEEIYIHMELVWYFLMNYFNMTYYEIQNLTKEWLSDIYDIKFVNTHSGSQDYMESV